MKSFNGLVTVVVPTFNHDTYIFDCLDSIVAQTYQNIKIVIVDDASTDTTADRLMSLLVPLDTTTSQSYNTYKGVHKGVDLLYVRRNANGGPAATRNDGINVLLRHFPNTKLIGFLDSDDQWHEEKLERSIEAFQRAPEKIGMIYSDYTNIDVSTGVMVREYKEPFNQQRLYQECLANSDSVFNPAAFASIRKVNPTTGRVEYFPEDMRTAEDWMTWLAISEKFILVHIPEDLLLIRTHPKNSTNSVPPEVWQANWAKIRQKVHSMTNGQLQ